MHAQSERLLPVTSTTTFDGHLASGVPDPRCVLNLDSARVFEGPNDKLEVLGVSSAELFSRRLQANCDQHVQAKSCMLAAHFCILLNVQRCVPDQGD